MVPSQLKMMLSADDCIACLWKSLMLRELLQLQIISTGVPVEQQGAGKP